MSAEPSERHPLDELADDFLRRYRRGERPTVSEYARRYPELADQLHELLQALVLMEELGPDRPAAPPGRADAPEGGLPQLGEYRILREVGRGGMGVVYEAEQVSLGRHVALKVLPLHGLLDPVHLERFRREARVAARLHHTNIVPVFGVGEHDGLHYYAMQFIEGRGLDEVLREVRSWREARSPTGREAGPAPGAGVLAEGLLSGFARTARPDGGAAPSPGTPTEAPTRGGAAPAAGAAPSAVSPGWISLPARRHHYYRSVAGIGVQVADALAYAHDQGVLHRDVKPSNLLLDAHGTVWVTDFGLAKVEGLVDLTHTGDLLGTLRYMAPERFRGEADVRSDVYSLGLTLYELLTLHPAFPEADRARLIEQVTRQEPPRPRKLDRGIPADLETVVLKATAREPGRRYASARELADDLRLFLGDRPVVARRTRAWEHGWRWCWRNPALALLTGAVALLLLSTAVASLVGYTRTSAALDQAQRERERAVAHLYDTLVGEARATRLGRGQGYRYRAWELLGQALRLETPARDVEALRQGAVECLGDFVGLEPTVWADFPSEVEAIALHPDGSRAAVGLGDGTVVLRCFGRDTPPTRLPAHASGVVGLAFGPQGKTLVSVELAGRAKVWEAAGCVRRSSRSRPSPRPRARGASRSYRWPSRPTARRWRRVAGARRRFRSGTSRAARRRAGSPVRRTPWPAWSSARTASWRPRCTAASTRTACSSGTWPPAR